MADKAKHAFGTLERIDEALSTGTIDAYDVLFVKDANGKPYVGWIDKDGNKVIVREEEKIIVVEGGSLPESGEEGKVYIFNEDGYFWDGEKFVNLCKPTDLTELEAEVAKKANAEEVKAKFDQVVLDTNAYTDEKVEAALNEHLVKKYEFTNVPVGTIVDYREDEIRIMCPTDTVFTKQSVGASGDANSYYGTFKTYAPNDDAVGYIEHLNGVSDSEILTTFSVDKYGRRYQPTWLALAKYDESTDVWNYYGKNSSVDKYIGWDYQIDWYDANGVMIASDSIRINLSNEECHSEIKPYYVGSMMSEIDAKIEKRLAELDSAYEIIEF